MAGEWPQQAQVQRYGASRPPICEDVVALAGYQDSSTNPTGGPFRRRCLLSRSSACNLVLKGCFLGPRMFFLGPPQEIFFTTAAPRERRQSCVWASWFMPRGNQTWPEPPVPWKPAGSHPSQKKTPPLS